MHWPLPVLAPPSQCTVAACLRHGSLCQRLTAPSLPFPCSGWRATRCHPHYSTEQPRGEDSPWPVRIEPQVSLYVKDIEWQCFCVSVLVWPFTHPQSLDQISDQSCGRVREIDWERERERGVLVVFHYISLSGSSFICLPSSLLSGLKQCSESNFLSGYELEPKPSKSPLHLRSLIVSRMLSGLPGTRSWSSQITR